MARTEWIEVEIKAETDQAVFVDHEGKTAWIPKSQVIDYEDDIAIGVTTKIEVAEWMLVEKGLV